MYFTVRFRMVMENIKFVMAEEKLEEKEIYKIVHREKGKRKSSSSTTTQANASI